jgi:SAM-dependent methyltransferase
MKTTDSFNNVSLCREILDIHWTSHNIYLDDKISTISAQQPSIGDDTRTRAIKYYLDKYLNKQQTNRVIDLGCLEGGVSLELARAGYQTLGVEGQSSNFEKCKLVKRYFDLDNLDFIHQDVKTLESESVGTFNAIVCCGLLYHLDDPVDFLSTLNEITDHNSVLFLDTHVAPEDHMINQCKHAGKLSEMVGLEHQEHQYLGRWFEEYLDDERNTGKGAWSAASNSRSFWLTKESLLRALYHNNFKFIEVPYGIYPIENEFELRNYESRHYFIAQKSVNI